MNTRIEQIHAFIDGKREEIFAAWADIVRLESYYDDPEGLSLLANHLKKEFEAEGNCCYRTDCIPTLKTKDRAVLSEA